jgi:hypothetical protein
VTYGDALVFSANFLKGLYIFAWLAFGVPKGKTLG